MFNQLGEFDLGVVWITSSHAEWKAVCGRCNLTAQTDRIGQYTESTQLYYLMRNHICDPSKKVTT